MLSRAGVVSVKHVVVLRPGASCHAHGSSADKRVARAIWRNADKQLVSKDGKLPGAEGRSAHFESRGEEKENVEKERCKVEGKECIIYIFFFFFKQKTEYKI